MPTSPPGRKTWGVVAPYLAIDPAYNAALDSIASTAAFVALDFSFTSPGRSFLIASASLITKSYISDSFDLATCTDVGSPFAGSYCREVVTSGTPPILF